MTASPISLKACWSTCIVAAGQFIIYKLIGMKIWGSLHVNEKFEFHNYYLDWYESKGSRSKGSYPDKKGLLKWQVTYIKRMGNRQM